jgi:hypothetical protein
MKEAGMWAVKALTQDIIMAVIDKTFKKPVKE